MGTSQSRWVQILRTLRTNRARAASPAARTARALPHRHVSLEPLESRTLLAADLTGSWTGLDLLPAVFSGTTMPAVTLRVQNDGDVNALAGSSVDIFLSTDNVLDTLVDTKVATAKLGTLKPAAFKDLIFKKIKLSPGMDAGDVFLIARIDANNKNAEGDEANNDIASPAALPINQPDYDLSGTMAKPSMNLQLVQGVINKGTVKLTLTNSGTVKIPTSKINVAFFLRPAANADNDASGDIAIGTLANQSASLLATKSKTLTGKLTLDAAVPAGDYKVVAVFDTGDTLAETDEANNTVIGTDIYTLSAAFADLGITAATVTAAANIPAGAKAVVSFTVFNNGNVAAIGATGVTLVAKAAGHPDVPLLTVDGIKFSVKAGFTKTVKVVFNVPLLLINGVLYDVEITITPTTAAGGDIVGNNVTTVGSAFTPSIPAVLASDIGDKVTFSGEHAGAGDSATASGPSHKLGNFIDGNGRQGTYDYRNNESSPFETGTLTLTWTDGQQPAFEIFSLLYGNEGGPHGLNGRTMRVLADINSEVVGQIAVNGLTILGFVRF